ncbi:DUF2690 domain-containing protein [Streptomyces sp. BR123]|uniref:DUF2690 domain-containing protein n=1 Tax=Streptomyces sp. BR123 TaxID=2749828 RepID=UPI0015C43D56|nr:DUF2690 domain-containing protein [Streptomyces sp. BR123]NXY93799.1 DUF2690 domain-containing protein [Streptomyces sp. BR123]
MTTSDTDGDTAEPPARPPQAPAARRPWFAGATALALVVAMVGAVLAAFVTPLGDHLMKALLDEPTCPGKACDGKNPQNQGCGEDARTFKPEINNPALLQIRRSEDCKAAWARIERGNPGDLVTVKVAGGTKRTSEVEYGDDQFTHMVAVPDGDFQITACAIPKAGGKSTYATYCVHATEATAWR